ncbi:hypothetical protein MBLNU459_g3681t2 [Dothideomycetes sp. NU459]
MATTTVNNALDGGMSAVEGIAVRQIIPHFNLGLVAASVAVSLIGAFTSTQLICCARSARTFLAVLVWTILSSFVFGFCAVFCIHEIAMLACEFDVPAGIDPTWTIVSATLATVFTFAALAGGTLGEFYKDKEGRETRHRLARDTVEYEMIGDDHNPRSGTLDRWSETGSDAGLLDEEHANQTSTDASEESIYGMEVPGSQKPSNKWLPAFMKHDMLSFKKTGISSVELVGQDVMTPKPSAAAARTSSSDVSASGTSGALGRLPRTKEASQSQSSNVFMATISVVYMGLTVGNIVKGLLWSLSLTSMHYCGLWSLKIPNGFVVLNPALVVLAATICWNVCIVGAIFATIAIVTCLAANFLLVHTATVSRNKLAEIVLTRRELWRAIAQKESAEAAALARSEFIASASHEIRTPLHHLQGYGDLLARRSDLSHDARALLQSIQGATKTLSSITNNVLDWSRIENDKSEYNATTFDIRSACESVVNLLPYKDEENDVDVFVVVAPDVPQNIFLDEGYLHRIVMNLLSNAIKFTSSGFILLVLDLVKSDLVITVKDTGQGMPAAFLPVMFDPFKQAQSRAMSRGTGLGLSIIKQLVHKMHGTISVDSQFDKDVGEGRSGTTFTVTIPLPQLTLSIDEDAVESQTEPPLQVAILENFHNLRAMEGLQLAWEKFGCQTTIVKPAHFAREVQNSNDKWKYIVADISVLDQASSISPALQKNEDSLVLVPYDEQRGLQGLPELPAHMIPLRKPLVWHTFEARIATAKDSSAKCGNKVRFANDATIVASSIEVAPSPKEGIKAYTILLVEDNPINQKLGQKMLASLGYNVLLAEDGEVAIEQLRRHDELVDLVLMDQSMPRKDGTTATREIRAMEAEGLFSRSPRIIIAVTAGVGPHAQTMCLDAGMDGFLTKPLSLAKLEDVMSKLLPT